MRKNPRRILSPQRLPFRHSGTGIYNVNESRHSAQHAGAGRATEPTVIADKTGKAMEIQAGRQRSRRYQFAHDTSLAAASSAQLQRRSQECSLSQKGVGSK
jgi:hypothetical protein